MTVQPIRPGDTFLLFHSLPYDFKEDLPLPMGPNVYLDYTPQNVLDAAKPPALADYVYPGYNLEGSGLTNCCLRSPATTVPQPKIIPSDIFFLSMTALRLRAPLAIEIAGQFELGRQDDLIKNPVLFFLKSPSPSNACYSGEDIHVSEELTKRQIYVADNRYTRVTSAIVFFAQVTCGLSWSFQMCYLALFASLEALFVPEGKNKAAVLACRASNFLSLFKGRRPLDFLDSAGIQGWLKKEYKDGRSNLVHGVQDVTPWTKSIEPKKVDAFGRLHEITRLCILGFLSLDNDKLALHSNSSGNQLQRWLDSLGPATGRFLKDQRMWCD